MLSIERIQRELAESEELFELSRDEGDDDTLNAVAADVQATARRVEDLEFRRMFSNPMDPGSCFLDI